MSSALVSASRIHVGAVLIFLKLKVINGQRAYEAEAPSTREKDTAVSSRDSRIAAPKTNVLVLEQPGREPDELGRKRFADSLATLKGEFETKLICTNQKTMETAPPADEVLTIAKHNRVSRAEGA